MPTSSFISRFYLRLKHSYGLDVRALSLMRIAVALVLLIDLAVRATSLTAHYTNAGIVPFNPIELSFWKPGYFSLFQFNDSYGFALMLFIATALIYLFLLAGCKTKLVTFLAWFMLTSLQNRNTLILQGGDDLLRLILFWGMFLPWGNFYSIDAAMLRQAKHPKKKKTTLSVATLAYVLLLFSVYFFTGLLKDSPEWCTEGTAIYYALNLDQMTWPLGKMLLPYTTLLKYATIFIRYFEIIIPFLLFIPYKNARFRFIFILCITALHLAICSTLFVGLFYLIGLATLIGLLPTSIMNRFDKLIKRKEKYMGSIHHNKSFLTNLSSNYYFNVIKNSFLSFCIALCMIWNISTVNGSGLAVSDRFNGFGYCLRFNQNWGMFAPNVFKDDGWYIFQGTTKDSLKIDLNRNGAKIDYAKPANILTLIKDDRWRKYQENYLFTYNTFIRPFYCNYLLSNWNKNHPDKESTSLKIIYMKEVSVLPNQKQSITPDTLCICK